MGESPKAVGRKATYTAPRVQNVVSWRTMEEGMARRFRRGKSQEDVTASAIGNRAARLINEYGNRNARRILRASANMGRRSGTL